LQSFPDVLPDACVTKAGGFAVVFGFLLPTVLLGGVEQRSRAAFASSVRAAAGETVR